MHELHVDREQPPEADMEIVEETPHVILGQEDGASMALD